MRIGSLIIGCKLFIIKDLSRSWVAHDVKEIAHSDRETLVRPEFDSHAIEIIFRSSTKPFPREEAIVVLKPATSNEPIGGGAEVTASNRLQGITPKSVLVVVSGTGLQLALENGLDLFLFRRVIDQVLGLVAQVQTALREQRGFKVIDRAPHVVEGD